MLCFVQVAPIQTGNSRLDAIGQACVLVISLVSVCVATFGKKKAAPKVAPRKRTCAVKRPKVAITDEHIDELGARR